MKRKKKNFASENNLENLCSDPAINLGALFENATIVEN